MEGIVPITLFMDNSGYHIWRRWNRHSSGWDAEKCDKSRVVIVVGISDTSHRKVNRWM